MDVRALPRPVLAPPPRQPQPIAPKITPNEKVVEVKVEVGVPVEATAPKEKYKTFLYSKEEEVLLFGIIFNRFCSKGRLAATKMISKSFGMQRDALLWADCNKLFSLFKSIFLHSEVQRSTGGLKRKFKSLKTRGKQEPLFLSQLKKMWVEEYLGNALLVFGAELFLDGVHTKPTEDLVKIVKKVSNLNSQYKEKEMLSHFVDLSLDFGWPYNRMKPHRWSYEENVVFVGVLVERFLKAGVLDCNPELYVNCPTSELVVSGPVPILSRPPSLEIWSQIKLVFDKSMRRLEMLYGDTSFSLRTPKSLLRRLKVLREKPGLLITDGSLFNLAGVPPPSEVPDLSIFARLYVDFCVLNDNNVILGDYTPQVVNIRMERHRIHAFLNPRTQRA